MVMLALNCYEVDDMPRSRALRGHGVLGYGHNEWYVSDKTTKALKIE